MTKKMGLVGGNGARLFQKIQKSRQANKHLRQANNTDNNNNSNKNLFAELSLNRFKVPHRIHRIVYVNNLVIFKRPHDMKNAVHGLNVTQKCITLPRIYIKKENYYQECEGRMKKKMQQDIFSRVMYELDRPWQRQPTSPAPSDAPLISPAISMTISG